MEEVDANKVDWRVTLWQVCVDEVVNSREKKNSCLDDGDDANESSSPKAIVATKEAFIPSL